MRKSKYIKKYYKRKYKKKYAAKKSSYKTKSRFRRKKAYNSKSWRYKAKAVELKKGYENSGTVNNAFTAFPPAEPYGVAGQKDVSGPPIAPWRTITGRWVNNSSATANGATVPIIYDNTGITGGLSPQTWVCNGIYPGQGTLSYQRIGTKIDVHRISWKFSIRKVFQCSNYPSTFPIGPFANELIDQYCNYGFIIVFAPTWGNQGANGADFQSNLTALGGDSAYWESYRNGTVPFNYLTDTYKVKEVRRRVFKMNQLSSSYYNQVALSASPMDGTIGSSWLKTRNGPAEDHHITMSLRFSKGLTMKWNEDGSGPPQNFNYACMLIWYGCSGIKVQFERYISYVDA